MKSKILKRTGLKPKQYEDILFETYLICMSEIARNPQHLQLLLINKPINKWFVKEVEKINSEFDEVTTPYLPLDKIEVAKAYKNYIRRIGHNYPGALINSIKFNRECSLRNN